MSNKPATIWKRMWARSFAPYMGGVFLPVFGQRSAFGLWHHTRFVPEGNLHAMLVRGDEFDALVARVTAYLLRQNLRAYARRYEAAFASFLVWARGMSRRTFSALSDTQMASLQARVNRRMTDLAELQFMAFVVLEGPSAEVERRLAGQANGGRALAAVGTPQRETEIARARLRLLQLVASGSATPSRLAAYALRYAWITVYQAIDPPLDAAAVRQQLPTRLGARAELAAYRTHLRRQLGDYRALIRRVHDRRLRRRIALAHAFAYLKEMRDDYRRHAYFLLRPYWQEVGRRLGLTLEATHDLLPDELVTALRTGRRPSDRVLAQRRRSYALLGDGGAVRIVTGARAQRLARQARASNANRQVAGSSACPGIVRGRVCVVYHQGEFAKFKRGDVLVTTMTHPEFVPIMRQALALVTDEGGITCHAAIVSRELGLPCVIGTKVATQVLHDGDYVEVDATKGIVRKLR